MTPDQSRAIARWFSSEKFRRRSIEKQFEIRGRATKGWDRLTPDERAEVLDVGSRVVVQ